MLLQRTVADAPNGNAELLHLRQTLRWFGEGYNSWYVGKITEVKRRRTKQENVSVEFEDEQYGTT